MRVELGIGVAGVVIGLALMLTGQRMCRTDLLDQQPLQDAAPVLS